MEEKLGHFAEQACLDCLQTLVLAGERLWSLLERDNTEEKLAHIDLITQTLKLIRPNFSQNRVTILNMPSRQQMGSLSSSGGKGLGREERRVTRK